MQTCIVNRYEQLDRLKGDWDSAYSADPHTTIFMSWAWIRAWCEITPYDWSILAVRPHSKSQFVAFMVIGKDVDRSSRFFPVHNLHVGGNPFSDHVGFVCLPEFAEEAIAALACFVKQRIRWDNFFMHDVFDPRFDVFLKHFQPKRFYVRRAKDTACPYISLPDTWEQFLQEFLSKHTRKNLLYSMRRLERDTEFRITQIQSGNWRNQIETLLKLYELRWQPSSNHTLTGLRTIFRRCYESDCLWLPVLWDRTTPIAAMAAFVNKKRKVFQFYILGWDSKFAKLSPGNVVIAYGIRYAIEHGYRIFDFLRGREDYKYSFGAIDRFNANVLIVQKNPILAARKAAGRLKRSLLTKAYCNR